MRCVVYFRSVDLSSLRVLYPNNIACRSRFVDIIADILASFQGVLSGNGLVASASLNATGVMTAGGVGGKTPLTMEGDRNERATEVSRATARSRNNRKVPSFECLEQAPHDIRKVVPIPMLSDCSPEGNIV
jgi:hypothetical protein